MEKSLSFRARGTPVIGLRSKPEDGGGLRNFSCHQSLRQLPDVLFIGQASLTGKRIAAGHIGKKLQFPRTRHSRDRIAERAIRGGGLRNYRCVNFPTCFYIGRASLARKRIAAGNIGKELQFPRTWHSRDRIAERAIRGGASRNLRLVIIIAQLPARVLFVGRAS